ncbi:hypothetical protein PTSG_12123 [Salpingoeca rosetta]|uniref:Uncharacterized protein n=1 Tax=Salpingoeca rosetta (strain ATCC 50818 / BSB-021) TaxID=946362 RepID=F2U7N3_SALR5|nr:uncharacterized protein PTSG_12123 [Salpingoeca rosetta]EGD83450.1 hypothetical protein PTSG_12123 [Salpingoeca rosetta]|eukprot:XP_004994954.1 hypothetical protein PTSG_12123 [Salpingoeca rosetta]
MMDHQHHQAQAQQRRCSGDDRTDSSCSSSPTWPMWATEETANGHGSVAKRMVAQRPPWHRNSPLASVSGSCDSLLAGQDDDGRCVQSPPPIASGRTPHSNDGGDDGDDGGNYNSDHDDIDDFSDADAVRAVLGVANTSNNNSDSNSNRSNSNRRNSEDHDGAGDAGSVDSHVYEDVEDEDEASVGTVPKLPPRIYRWSKVRKDSGVCVVSATTSASSSSAQLDIPSPIKEASTSTATNDATTTTATNTTDTTTTASKDEVAPAQAALGKLFPQQGKHKQLRRPLTPPQHQPIIDAAASLPSSPLASRRSSVPEDLQHFQQHHLHQQQQPHHQQPQRARRGSGPSSGPSSRGRSPSMWQLLWQPIQRLSRSRSRSPHPAEARPKGKGKGKSGNTKKHKRGKASRGGSGSGSNTPPVVVSKADAKRGYAVPQDAVLAPRDGVDYSSVDNSRCTSACSSVSSTGTSVSGLDTFDREAALRSPEYALVPEEADGTVHELPRHRDGDDNDDAFDGDGDDDDDDDGTEVGDSESGNDCSSACGDDASIATLQPPQHDSRGTDSDDVQAQQHEQQEQQEHEQQEQQGHKEVNSAEQCSEEASSNDVDSLVEGREVNCGGVVVTYHAVPSVQQCTHCNTTDSLLSSFGGNTQHQEAQALLDRIYTQIPSRQERSQTTAATGAVTPDKSVGGWLKNNMLRRNNNGNGNGNTSKQQVAAAQLVRVGVPTQPIDDGADSNKATDTASDCKGSGVSLVSYDNNDLCAEVCYAMADPPQHPLRRGVHGVRGSEQELDSDEDSERYDELSDLRKSVVYAEVNKAGRGKHARHVSATPSELSVRSDGYATVGPSTSGSVRSGRWQ